MILDTRVKHEYDQEEKVIPIFCLAKNSRDLPIKHKKKELRSWGRQLLIYIIIQRRGAYSPSLLLKL